MREELGIAAVSQLRQIYTAFSTYGQWYNGAAGMDGARFTKLTADCGLAGRGRRLKNTDVDLVFAKVRTRGARVITFEQFVDALAELAQRAALPLVDVARHVLSTEGPVTRATEAIAVRFYDDKVRLRSALVCSLLFPSLSSVSVLPLLFVSVVSLCCLSLSLLSVDTLTCSPQACRAHTPARGRTAAARRRTTTARRTSRRSSPAPTSPSSGGRPAPALSLIHI